MANMRAKILKALDVQAEHEGETENVKACRIVLQHVTTSDEWQALIRTGHHRYGKMSYEVHLFYYLRDWVAPMCAALVKAGEA